HCFVDIDGRIATFDKAANEFIGEMRMCATVTTWLAQFWRKQVPVSFWRPLFHMVRGVADQWLAGSLGVQVRFQRSIEGITHHGGSRKIAELADLRHVSL